MGIREKHLAAKLKKKDLKNEIKVLRKKIKKHERKIAKMESKLDSLNLKIKEYKKNLRKRKTWEAEKQKKRKKELVKKERTLVPESEKKLRKVPKIEKALRKLEKKEKSPAPFVPEKQDLTLIEGIGEKTAQLLNEKGIFNYRHLANCSSDALDEILKQHFPNHQLFTTLTWPEQALLAHKEQWEELKKLQDKLKGGNE